MKSSLETALENAIEKTQRLHGGKDSLFGSLPEKKKLKNIVFITNIKNPVKPGRTDAYDLSIYSWKVWCEKNSCDLFVLDEPLMDLSTMSPIYYRHYWPQLLPEVTTEQICTVDADTIIHPDCPNFFELIDNQFCGVHNDGDYDWIIRSIENYQFEFPEFFTKKFNIWKYINSGFMITSRQFDFVHQALLDFYWENQVKLLETQKKYGVGTDQPLINLITNEIGLDVNILPYRYNMQDLPRKGVLDERFLFCQIPGIYHFNAIPGGPEQVNFWMKKTFEFLKF